jgi:two-component system, NarL family, nitrate/nitrite response regulator NarL
MTPAPGSLNSDAAIRLLLVDDHPLVRDGLRARLERDKKLTVSADTGTYAEAVSIVTSLDIDLALIDINLNGASGIELTAHLRALQPSLAIIILSMHDGIDYVEAAMQAGANGYVLKGAPSDEIIAAIHAVSAGKSCFSHQLQPSRAHGASPLTPREREVLRCIAQGKSNKHIARELDLSVSTVDTHRVNIKRKLGIEGKAELIRYGLVLQSGM